MTTIIKLAEALIQVRARLAVHAKHTEDLIADIQAAHALAAYEQEKAVGGTIKLRTGWESRYCQLCNSTREISTDSNGWVSPCPVCVLPAHENPTPPGKTDRSRT